MFVWFTPFTHKVEKCILKWMELLRTRRRDRGKKNPVPMADHRRRNRYLRRVDHDPGREDRGAVVAVIIGIIGGLLWLVGLRFQRAFHDTLDII